MGTEKETDTKELNKLKKALEQEEAARKSAEERALELLNKNEDLTRQVRELGAHVAGLTGELQKKINETDELKSANDEGSEQLREVSNRLSDMTNEISLVRQELMSTVQAKEAAEKQVADITNQYNSLNTAYQKALDGKATYRNALLELSREIN